MKVARGELTRFQFFNEKHFAIATRQRNTAFPTLLKAGGGKIHEMLFDSMGTISFLIISQLNNSQLLL